MSTLTLNNNSIPSKIEKFISVFNFSFTEKPKAAQVLDAVNYFVPTKTPSTLTISNVILNLSIKLKENLPTDVAPSLKEINQNVAILNEFVEGLESLFKMSNQFQIETTDVKQAIENFHTSHKNFNFVLDYMIGVKCVAEARKEAKAATPFTLEELIDEINRPLHVSIHPIHSSKEYSRNSAQRSVQRKDNW